LFKDSLINLKPPKRVLKRKIKKNKKKKKLKI